MKRFKSTFDQLTNQLLDVIADTDIIESANRRATQIRSVILVQNVATAELEGC